MSKIRPLSDNVVIKPILEEKTAGGILLPDSAKKEASTGKVLAVGPGRYIDGKVVPVDVKVGDTVLFSYGKEIDHEDQKLMLVSETNIDAVLE